MGYPAGQNEQRRELRVGSELLARISIGSQLTIQGKLKDLSIKSAFITIKASIYLQLNDEVGFAIQVSPDNVSDVIQGLARISRIVPGEGLAIYFTRMDAKSEARLKDHLKR